MGVRTTELFDVNGDEIYDGDAVLVPYVTPMGKIVPDDRPYRAHVFFSKGCFWLSTRA